MPRMYHKPKQIIPEVNKKLTHCGSECPCYKNNNGQGHCDDWRSCEHPKVRAEIWNWQHKIVDGFPEICPLKEVD